MIGRVQYLAQLASEFPEIASGIGPVDAGLLHLEVAAFRQATEQAMDTGRKWLAQQHFLFVDRLLQDADPALRNALEVSYLEDLALGDCTPDRHQTVKERMPRSLRDIMIEHSGVWQ